jgi:RND family efflux transporter MFP subunit
VKAVPHWLVATGKVLAAAAGIALLVLWLMGAFRAKVEPNAGHTVRAHPEARTLTVRVERVPVVESAVGTIEAIERIAVGSRLMARVEAVHVTAGQPVKEGDLLMELEKTELQARLQKARAAQRAAEAALSQAEIDVTRTRELFEQKIASQSRLDKDETAVKQWKAEVRSAKEAVAEAETVLGYATIRAPTTGIVVDRQVEPGSLASPGQVLVTLYDPKRLQLVASVREQIAAELQIGQSVKVRIDAIGKTCEARVAQIVPEAEPQSRAFSVKVTGPCPPNVYAGMFGRMILPVGEREEILVPETAVQTLGQVEIVFVVLPDGGVLRRFVRTGRNTDDRVEILSGLRPGETIVADTAQLDRR